MPLTNAYVSMPQLKAWLGLSDTVDDTLLEIAANAASRQIDRYTNRRFYLDAAASARTFRATSDGVLWVDDIGDTAGLVVKTDLGDDGTYETTWASTDYETGPPNAIALGQPITHLRAVESNLYPYTGLRTGVEVTAKWGWPSVPDDIVQACLILSTRLFKRKDSPEGVAGFADFGAVRLSRMDPDVQALLNPFRIIPVG